MSSSNYIIFDFDGTIADTIDLAINIFNGISYEYDCKPVSEGDRELLRKSRSSDLLKEYGISDLKLVRILLRMRKEMSNPAHELKPVIKIPDSLKTIKGQGFNLGILTSNSVNTVRAFLACNGLSDMIDFIYSGKSLFGKDKVLERLLDKEKIPRGNVIYIGDETRDIEASRKAGVPVIAVTWGLNHRDVLSALDPDQIADTPDDILRCVQQIITDR
jgi:phosphoglycolate phosphatase-like HAD superfamily hydrolase